MKEVEKIVKQTIKLISKTQNLNYEELKVDAKKMIKAARNYDEALIGIMEELLELSNIGSEEELEDINVEVLKIYCRIKGIDDEGSERSLRARVWQNMEEEFELDSDEEDESEDESVVSEDPEPELEQVPEPEPPTPKKPKKKEKVVVINN